MLSEAKHLAATTAAASSQGEILRFAQDDSV
jgi:hypothetical protein